MRELENGVARGEPEVPSFGIDIACRGLVKCCLIPFDFVNTSAWPELSHALYALILHSPIDHWILSLTTIINSWTKQ